MHAAALGAHWVELDVQTCGTGEIVVIHDPDLGRLAGLPEAVVARLPLAELQSIDVGSHFSAEQSSARVPTLAQVIEALRGRVRFHVEVKEYGVRGDGTAARTAALLARMVRPDEVLVTSYNPFALARVRSASAGLPRGLIHPPEGGLPGPRRALRDRAFRRPWSAPWLGAGSVLPRWPTMERTGVARAQRRGLSVIPWVVDEPAEMKELFELGVDGIVTNRPDLALPIAGHSVARA